MNDVISIRGLHLAGNSAYKIQSDLEASGNAFNIKTVNRSIRQIKDGREESQIARVFPGRGREFHNGNAATQVAADIKSTLDERGAGAPTLTKMADLFNVGKASVSKYVKKAGYKSVKKWQRKEPARKFPKNERGYAPI